MTKNMGSALKITLICTTKSHNTHTSHSLTVPIRRWELSVKLRSTCLMHITGPRRLGCLNFHGSSRSPFLPILNEASHRRAFHLSAQRRGTKSFILADIGEGITEVTIKEWYVKVGDRVEQFDNICEVQSDKASVTITSRFDGVIEKLHYNVDDMAAVGKPLFDVRVDDAKSGNESESEEATEPDKRQGTGTIEESPAEEERSRPIILATPAVRRIAAEHKVDLRKVTGTGRSGRIMKEDIVAFVSLTNAPSSSMTPAPGSGQPPTHTRAAPAATIMAQDRVVPIQGYMKTMAKTMSMAQKVPHFVYCDEVNLTALYELREAVKQSAERRGVKLTLLHFIIKACSIAMTEFPNVNAHVSEDCTEVTIKASHNIGIAVDSPGGLIVPNMKNVQNLQIMEIAREAYRLQTEAKRGTLKPADLTGGTFTLSNIGAIGGTYAAPVLLVPEIAIGALGKMQTVPRFGADGSVVATKIMNVSWAADHRVLDGATVARFSNRFKEVLESPIEILL